MTTTTARISQEQASEIVLASEFAAAIDGQVENAAEGYIFGLKGGRAVLVTPSGKLVPPSGSTGDLGLEIGQQTTDLKGRPVVYRGLVCTNRYVNFWQYEFYYPTLYCVSHHFLFSLPD